MNHDIIDNRKEKLIDHINRILSSTESARFAVGYFFLPGLQEHCHQPLAGCRARYTASGFADRAGRAP
jgi:hypothetical protein